MLDGPSFPPESNRKIVSWIFRIIAAAILLQSLIFKFGAHPDSISLFQELGADPYGRYTLGEIELFISFFILNPRSVLPGAILGIGIMTGAILSHIFILGIVFQNDGGKLFSLAIICFLACAGQVVLLKNQLISYLKKGYVI